MEYIDVEWVHDSPENPTRLVSELDEARYETRKLEFFRDGRVGFSDSSRSSGGTDLGSEPVPPLEEINDQPEFRGISIDRTTFESLWSQYADE